MAFALNVVYTCVNAYLGINFGIGLSFGIVTVLLSRFLLNFIFKGVSKGEAVATMIMAAGGGYTAVMLAYNILTRVEVPESNLPLWLIPSKDVLLSRRILCWEWATPIFISVVILTLIPAVIGLIYGLAVNDVVSKCRSMVFPFYSAEAMAANACFEEEKSARALLIFLFIGVILTTLQYGLKVFGIDLIDFDFTPNLPYGFAFGFFANLAIIALGYIIESSVSLTILIAGIGIYFVVAPILVYSGFVPYTNVGSRFYTDLLYNHMISPALGTLLLSGILLIGIKKARKFLGGRKDYGKEMKKAVLGLSFVDFLRGLRIGFRDKKLIITFIASTTALIVWAITLNFLYPYPTWVSIVYTILFVAPIGIVDSYVILKMSGETGLPIGIYRFLLYQAPITASGYRGYAAHLAYPSVNPWAASTLNGNLKIGEMTGTSKRSVVKATILSLLPSALAGTLFTLFVWKYIGLLNELFPCVQFLQFLPMIKMFAKGSVEGVINPTTFIAGGCLGAVLQALTPASAMGIAMAMFLPPSYILTFGIGGLLRIYTDHKFGKKWFEENGRLIATGFITGSVIAQMLEVALMATMSF